ncbi:cysteine proteinase, partial [Rhodotorula sp. JG-1b]
VTGLVNLGNSCYLASIVQVLLATPPLEEFFLDDDYLREINTANRLGSGGELAEVRKQPHFIRGSMSSADPEAFTDEALARWAPQYSDESQQDAHECLLSLLDGLHEDLNLVLRPPPPVETSPARELALQQLPEVVAADMVWKEYRDRQDSVIVDFFHGQVRNRMECLRCHTTSSTFHAFQTLSLALPRAHSNTNSNARRRVVPTDLQGCIADYLQEEILRGENAWRCPTCKSPQVASKRVSIARLPQFLVIHLQRFAYNARKITTPISFPLSG